MKDIIDSALRSRSTLLLWLTTGDSISGTVTDVRGGAFRLEYRQCNPQWINMDHVVRIMEVKE